jgi:addiction module HigA family antidote
MAIKRPALGWQSKGITTHPGTILKEEFLEPMRISANHLAMRTRMPPTRVGQILHAKRAVTTDTALRLARYFGTSAEFWVNLQAAYDLSKARLESDNIIQRDVEPLNLEAIGA